MRGVLTRKIAKKIEIADILFSSATPSTLFTLTLLRYDLQEALGCVFGGTAPAAREHGDPAARAGEENAAVAFHKGRWQMGWRSMGCRPHRILVWPLRPVG